MAHVDVCRLCVRSLSATAAVPELLHPSIRSSKLGTRSFNPSGIGRAPKKHISKIWTGISRINPLIMKPNKVGDIPIKCLCLCAVGGPGFWVQSFGFLGSYEFRV